MTLLQFSFNVLPLLSIAHALCTQSWPHQISGLSIAVCVTVICRFLDALFLQRRCFCTDIAHFYCTFIQWCDNYLDNSIICMFLQVFNQVWMIKDAEICISMCVYIICSWIINIVCMHTLVILIIHNKSIDWCIRV